MEPSPGELWAGLGPWVLASHTRVSDASCRPWGVRILYMGGGETQCAGGVCGHGVQAEQGVWAGH